MIPIPHALEESWWDGAKRFQYVNRNVVAKIQNEDLFKFTKLFAPKQLGLHIGGKVKNSERVNWAEEKEPLSILLDLAPDAITDICARAEGLPFKDGLFGYIVSFHVFEHIRGNPVETLQEWARVLVQGGLIALSMPDKRHFLHDPNQTKDGITAYHEMEPDELFEIVKDLGFDILLFDSRENSFDFDLILRKP